MANKEHIISSFVVDDERVSLPEGAQILGVYYEAISKDRSIIAPIGDIHQLNEFRQVKGELERGNSEVYLKLRDDMARIPYGCFLGDVRMVIKALVPAPKPKGKYA